MEIVEKFELQPPAAEVLQWSVSSSDRETIVAFAGEIDLASAETVDHVLADVAAGHPGRLVVDLANVTFLDSTGIRQFMIAAEVASEIGCRFVLRHPTATIQRTLEICGLHDLMVEDSEGMTTEAPSAS